MAPLKVTANCLSCHEKQGYREGDIRGGISVSLPYAEVEAAAAQSIRQNWVTHGAIFLLGAAVGFVLLEALRRRWIYLAATITQWSRRRGSCWRSIALSARLGKPPSGQPGQDGLPGQYEPRIAHADECHYRICLPAEGAR